MSLRTLIALVCALGITHASAAVRSSGDSRYAIEAETFDGGGGFAANTPFDSQASAENFVIGSSQSAAYLFGHGFLFAVTSFEADVVPPTIACPTNITVNATPGFCAAVVSFEAIATDNNPGVTVSYNPAPGSSFPVGTTVVTVTATDARGNTASCLFTVTVRDAEAPTLNVPAPIVVGNALGACDAVVNFTVTASDNCSVTSVLSTPASGSTFPKGTTTVTSIATDAAGNSRTNTFTITVRDSEAPTLTMPAPMVVNNDPGTCGAVVNFTVNAADNCPGVTVVSTPASGAVFPRGTNTVISIATDAAGNASTNTFTITVNDREPPILQLTGPSLIDLAVGSTYTDAGAVASDNCGGPVPVVVGGDVVNTAVDGIYVITYNATDSSGNAAVPLTRTVRVTPGLAFTIVNALVGFKEVDLDQAAAVTGDILSQKKLTHGVKSVVTGLARNVTGPSELRESAQVNGNLETGGAATLNESASVGSNVISGGNVELRNKARVIGNVTASGNVTLHSAATVGGTVTESAPRPVFQDVLLPDLGLVPARPDIEVPKDGLLNLPPGTYGKLDLKQSATLALMAGTYNFEQIDAALRAAFKLDVRQGPLKLNVLGNVSVGQEVKFLPQAAPGDSAALKILLQVEGTRAGLDRKTEFVGTILAPEAVIDVGQQVTITGALYGRRVQVSADSTVAGAPAVSLLNGASPAWLGYRNDCEAVAVVPAGTPDPLLRLAGQAVYGCLQVDLGTAVMITGNVAAQQNIQLSASSRVTGNLLAASGNADLGASVEVTGSVEAGGRVDLATQAKVGANVVSGGNVSLGTRAAVTGSVTAAGKVQIHNTATVGGTVKQNAVVPPIPAFFLPRLGLRAPGELVEVPQDAELSLLPGVYGDLSMKQNAKLRLSAGTYRFDTLDAGQRATVELDVTLGSIVINVVDTLAMDERTQMNAIAPAGTNAAGRVLFQVQGKRVTLGQNGIFFGTFMAPNADIELRQDSKFQGALFGASIRLGPKAEAQVQAALDLMFAAALDWKVPGGGSGLTDSRSSGQRNEVRNAALSTPPRLITLNAPMIELAALRDGRAVLRITGRPGFTGQLQVSDRLIGGQWKALTSLDGSTGTVEFTDESAMNTAVRFYRVVTAGKVGE
jgi:cytoskeletal protein CcmA (bactofilin family)